MIAEYKQKTNVGILIGIVLQLVGRLALIPMGGTMSILGIIVALVGSGSCSFKDCVITLDVNGQKSMDDRKPLLAAATVVDALNMMADPKPERGPARLSFENCFVLVRLESVMYAGVPPSFPMLSNVVEEKLAASVPES